MIHITSRIVCVGFLVGLSIASGSAFAPLKTRYQPRIAPARQHVWTTTSTPTIRFSSWVLAYDAMESYQWKFSANNTFGFRDDGITAERISPPATMVWDRPTTTDVAQRRKRPAPVKQDSREFRVFCDLDGVLVDFESGIRRVFPNEPNIHHVTDVRRVDMWRRLEASGPFFETLPWTNQGKALWKLIQPLRPDILTGVPAHQSSRTEKYAWCARELGIPVEHVDRAGRFHSHSPSPTIMSRKGNINQVEDDDSPRSCRVITCWSFNKHYESGPNAVLIDDRESLREAWERKGGIFIHHDGSLHRTVAQLVDHGILTPEQIPHDIGVAWEDDDENVLRP